MHWIINFGVLLRKSGKCIFLFEKLQILQTNSYALKSDVIIQLNRFNNSKFRLSFFALSEFLYLYKKIFIFFGKNEISDVVVIKGKSIHLLLQQ